MGGHEREAEGGAAGGSSGGGSRRGFCSCRGRGRGRGRSRGRGRGRSCSGGRIAGEGNRLVDVATGNDLEAKR